MQGNRPAHFLARHASSVDDYVIWIEKYPIMIESVLIQNVMFLSFFLIKLRFFSLKKKKKKKRKEEASFFSQNKPQVNWN